MSPKVITPTVEQTLALLAERIRHLETADKYQFGGKRNAQHFEEGSSTGGIQEAYNNLVNDPNVNGGTIVRPPGSISQTANIIPTATDKRIHIEGYGVTLNLATGITGFLANQGVGPLDCGCVIEGFKINGGGNANTIGVEFRDTRAAFLRNVEINDCVVGWKFHNFAAGKFTEVCGGQYVHVRDCATGIEFDITAGNASFGETTLRDIYVSLCDTGVDITNGCDLYRSVASNLNIWITQNQTGIFIDGTMRDARWDLHLETQGVTAGTIGIDIGTNAGWMEHFIGHISRTGTFATLINNPFAKPLPRGLGQPVAIPFLIGTSVLVTNPGMVYVAVAAFLHHMYSFPFVREQWSEARITARVSKNEAGQAGICIYNISDAAVLCEALWNGAGAAIVVGDWTEIVTMDFDKTLELRVRGSSGTEDMTIYNAWLQLR